MWVFVDYCGVLFVLEVEDLNGVVCWYWCKDVDFVLCDVVDFFVVGNKLCVYDVWFDVLDGVCCVDVVCFEFLEVGFVLV